jgi:hypothetical protein
MINSRKHISLIEEYTSFIDREERKFSITREELKEIHSSFKKLNIENVEYNEMVSKITDFLQLDVSETFNKLNVVRRNYLSLIDVEQQRIEFDINKMVDKIVAFEEQAKSYQKEILALIEDFNSLLIKFEVLVDELKVLYMMLLRADEVKELDISF